jgi:hypothetical protein
MENDQTHQEMLDLLRQNNALLRENNVILKKQEKRARNGMILKVIWIFVLVILPLLLLPYIMSGLTTGLGIGSDGSAAGLESATKNAQDLLNSLPK